MAPEAASDDDLSMEFKPFTEMSEDQAVYAAPFRRMWADRHSERVHVFANGHVYDRAERRRAMRMNIGCQRRFRDAA